MKHEIAIFGCGKIAEDAHIPALVAMEDVHIKYLFDLYPAKGEALARKFNLDAKIITDYKIALSDPEVDAVWVLTPNLTHYEITMDALRAGKHVMCEKPIAPTYAQASEMAAEATKQGKLLNIGVCNRFNRSVELLAEMVRDGKFGNIYHVVCSFREFRGIPGLGGIFTTKALSGGGVLIDIGIHFIDIVMFVLGGPKVLTVSGNIYSEMAKDIKSYKYRTMWAEAGANLVNGTNDVEDFATGFIRTDKGNISVNGSWAQSLDVSEKYIDFLGDKGGARLTYGGQFTFTDCATLESYTTNHEIPQVHAAQNRDFIRCLSTGEKNRNDISNILESARIIELLYQSAEANREIVL